MRNRANRLLLVFVMIVGSTLGVAVAQDASPPSDVGVVKKGVLHVSPREAAQLLADDQSIRVLDLRTRPEFNRGHIDGAIQINYFSLNLKKKLAALDRNASWLVHCKSGHRSGRAVPQMKKLGFTKIIHMDAGFDGWKKAGLPVTRER